MIPLARPWIDEAELEAALTVLRSGMLVQGAVVARFEEALAARCGRRFAIAVSSGTSALSLVYRALGPLAKCFARLGSGTSFGVGHVEIVPERPIRRDKDRLFEPPEGETGPKDLKKEDHSEWSRSDQSEARFFEQLAGAADRRFAELDRELFGMPIDGRTTASTSNMRSTRGFGRTSPSRARGASGRRRLSGVPDYPNAFVIA